MNNRQFTGPNREIGVKYAQLSPLTKLNIATMQAKTACHIRVFNHSSERAIIRQVWLILIHNPAFRKSNFVSARKKFDIEAVDFRFCPMCRFNKNTLSNLAVFRLRVPVVNCAVWICTGWLKCTETFEKLHINLTFECRNLYFRDFRIDMSACLIDDWAPSLSGHTT